jgi:hypothetical protein
MLTILDQIESNAFALIHVPVHSNTTSIGVGAADALAFRLGKQVPSFSGVAFFNPIASRFTLAGLVAE